MKGNIHISVCTFEDNNIRKYEKLKSLLTTGVGIPSNESKYSKNCIKPFVHGIFSHDINLMTFTKFVTQLRGYIFADKNSIRKKVYAMTFHYHPQTKLREGNVFTDVCSKGIGRWVHHMHHRIGRVPSPKTSDLRTSPHSPQTLDHYP